MKANELRIGNLYEFKGCLCTININTFAEFNLHLKEFQPIPLTEEWLLKFGFDNNRRLYLYGMADYFMSYDIMSDNSIFIYNEVETANNESLTMMGHIKYIHQLQNLYFALTGEELKIN